MAVMAINMESKSHERFFPKVPSISTRLFDVYSKHFTKVWLAHGPLILTALWWVWLIGLIGDVIFNDVFDLENLIES